jgi:DNA-binding NarL/FixJ family response regulator
LQAVRGENERARVLVAHGSVTTLDEFIALVDDHADFEIVAVATDGFEAVNTAQELQPDVSIFDLALPRLNGFEALRYARASVPRGAVIAISDLVADDARATRAELQVLLDGRLASDEPGIDLPVSSGSAARAREFVDAVARTHQREDLAAIATLLVSEVVTNAVVHARSASRLTVTSEGDALRCRLTDWGDGALELRRLAPAAAGGRGLHIVDGLASVWGTVVTPQWKRVFFVVGAGEAARAGARRVTSTPQNGP